jgi:regulator of sigma E protease
VIQSVLSIIVALGVLITFHEFGHYIVARACGVKVIRFSVGFGKPIFKWVNRLGTEFTLALIPLGGYVRMLDEREGDVQEHQKHEAFNNKTVWQRIAIVAAGPLANFLLAIILYAAVALQGIQTVTPIVGAIKPGSIIAQSSLQVGDEITWINGDEVASWQQVNLALANLIGQTGRYSFRYIPEGSSTEVESDFQLQAWLSDSEPAGLITELGLTPKRPQMPAIIETVLPDGAAELAGLKENDKVIKVDDDVIEDWQEFVNIVQKAPLKTLSVRLIRDNQEVNLLLTPNSRDVNGVATGYVGLMVKPVVLDASWYKETEYGFFESIAYGIDRSGQMINLTLSSIYKMIKGLISIDNLSGPITIAKVASASAESGLQSFLQFMAYLSISLGVLNLLPIPVLDGGHLLFYVVEAVRRRPVSEKVQYLAYRIGASMLFALMLVAIFNDIARL